MGSRVGVAWLMAAVMAVAGCGGDSPDEEPPPTELTSEPDEAVEATPPTEVTVATEETEPTEVTEETDNAAEDEPAGTDDAAVGVTTAVTTGNVVIVESFDEEGSVGEPAMQIEVTMDDDGQLRQVAVDEETLMTIWPDGVTAAGVRVTIEVVDGEQRVTGLAGSTPRPIEPTEETDERAGDDAPKGQMFADPFDGEPQAGWRWRFENPALRSLTDTPGWLTITATDPPQNVLVLDAPDGAFEAETTVRFTPTSNFQFAGIFVGTDETSYVQLGRAYCSSDDVPDFCVDDGVYMDNIDNEEIVDSSVVEIPGDADVVLLRLVVDGDSVTGYVSDDGESWTLVGEQIRSGAAIEVGLITGQAQVEPAVAEFDHFTLRR